MSVNVQFANLEPHVQDKFIDIAGKDPEGRTAAEWFEHLVPEPLQDSSAETEVFMDGGTVTQEVWVYDQGRGGGHYETVEHQIDDRDVSRIESGHNGGEYTHDNTIMEDSSINRSRGADDMTNAEYEFPGVRYRLPSKGPVSGSWLRVLRSSRTYRGMRRHTEIHRWPGISRSSHRGP